MTTELELEQAQARVAEARAAMSKRMRRGELLGRVLLIVIIAVCIFDAVVMLAQLLGRL